MDFVSKLSVTCVLLLYNMLDFWKEKSQAPGSLVDLPPEIVLYIFQWVAYDPTWTNWESSWRWWDTTPSLRERYNLDSWPRQSRQTLDDIKAISLSSRLFRDIAGGIIFRQVAISQIEDLATAVELLKPEKCQWIRRLSLSFSPDSEWKQSYTTHILTLIERSPHLIAFSNEVTAVGGKSFSVP